MTVLEQSTHEYIQECCRDIKKLNHKTLSKREQIFLKVYISLINKGVADNIIELANKHCDQICEHLRIK